MYLLTVMRMQCRSRGSPASSLAPTMVASFWMSFTRTMSMSFSQQKAWMRVKWICRAMSPSSSSSAASTQKATISGSLQEQKKREAGISDLGSRQQQLKARGNSRYQKELRVQAEILTHSSAWPIRRRPP